MKMARSATLSLTCALVLFAVVAVPRLQGQAAPPVPATTKAPAPRQPAARPVVARTVAPVAATVAEKKALLDQYCVTCHNNRLKTANFSIENADLAAIGEHAELWEKVVRKLRAGVMPPPDVRRPPLDQYEGLRDFLEAELDRNAAARPYPGAVVLHRLNRTEYGNAVRDLLDLSVDVTSLLPPDDAAHGFDNIAGSLTISPTLLESYTTAAARVARMAVGYWKTPTEATYLASSDASQNMHIDGLPFGTRGGIRVRHDFPADGEYRFEIRTSGSAASSPANSSRFSSTVSAPTCSSIRALASASA